RCATITVQGYTPLEQPASSADGIPALDAVPTADDSIGCALRAELLARHAFPIGQICECLDRASHRCRDADVLRGPLPVGWGFPVTGKPVIDASAVGVCARELAPWPRAASGDLVTRPRTQELSGPR